VLRNDDLDPQRSKPEYVQAMYEDLRWFGLEWDEGPDVGGPYAPYCQSQRREFYLEAWRKLYDGGALYACTCSRRELAQAADAPHEDDEPLYPGTCRGSRPSVDLPAGYNWRFRVPEGEVVRFLDGYHGEIEFVAERDFGDFLVWRRDDVPAYQLATVVDDAQMRITEVVRGADLLKSTARQLLLYYALDFPAPTFYHCPLVTDEHGVRLAKRHDSLSLRTLRQRGLQPENLREACT
jgi:glutamyl-tRNA synthetase